jgi:hypothetical protein
MYVEKSLLISTKSVNIQRLGIPSEILLQKEAPLLFNNNKLM